ncbi:hypothetical protein ACIBK8_21420 [Streptomyces sp. NPDC050161]|uniref:hypothetical protein n=1 Tax=Streptomyces sp. NPDC050161 TaxID=3365604 RepID=UPI0037A005C6
MSTESVEMLVNLITVLLVLAVGTRLGYALVNRSTAREVDVIDRHFANSLQMWERHHQLQHRADAAIRARSEMKESYERLGIWLYELDRRLSEVKVGAVSREPELKAKAQIILGERPWEIVHPPAELAACQFYWSAEVRKLLRSLEGPHSHFLTAVREATGKDNPVDANVRHRNENKVWERGNQLWRIIEEVRDQARLDLGVQDNAAASAPGNDV